MGKKTAPSRARRHGLVQVYTGNGKGKTTASIGLAVRSAGKGHRVIMIQFMKGKIDYGELKGLSQVKGARIEQFGRPDFVNKANPAKADLDLARKGLERAKEVIASGEYDLVILDELNIALDYKLVPLAEVVRMIKNRPAHVEVVLTGRYAPPDIVDLADLVTVMTEVKHPYMKGVEAREGIEF